MVMISSNSNNKSSGLALICDYSSDDEYSGDEKSTKERLPLPSSLLTSKVQHSDAITDDVLAHDGRIRSFPHERGNWATYIFIPFELSYEENEIVRYVINNVSTHIDLKEVENPHISLTRTFVLLHHWIEDFIKTTEQKLKCLRSFQITFDKLSIYTNEEKTRTFVGVDVFVGQQDLLTMVKEIDCCLKEFRLPKFYENPSFHMSLAWCLGDKKEKLEESLPSLNMRFQQMTIANPEFLVTYVSKLCCKTGNKLFTFNLQGS